MQKVNNEEHREISIILDKEIKIYIVIVTRLTTKVVETVCDECMQVWIHIFSILSIIELY